MSVPVLLGLAQMRRIRPHFPFSRRIPRLHGRRALGGIVVVIEGGLRWRDALPCCGHRETRSNRFLRWRRMGVFSRIFAALAGEAGEPDRLIIASPRLEAHRTAAGLPERGRPIGAAAAPRAGRTPGSTPSATARAAPSS